MTFANFLLAMVGPVAARLLSALGLSLVTMIGLTLTATTLKGVITANLGALPAAAIGLGGLYGFWEAIGLVLGAITFVLTWNATKGVWSLAKT